MALSERLNDLAYAAGWRVVRLLPERVASQVFDTVADVATRRDGKGVRRLRSNLARVVPAGTDLDALTRDAMRSYARYWMEVFRLPDMPLERRLTGFHLEDERVLRDAYAAGAGVILALPHMGNWEVAGAWLAGTGIPFTTVAERLLAGGCLCLLADRDLSARGVPVRFFGGQARMAAGPAALALRTGAVLLPTTLWFDGMNWRGRIHPRIAPTDVATMTQQMADAFAESISLYPADWHMLQRVWRDDEPPTSRGALETAAPDTAAPDGGAAADASGLAGTGPAERPPVPEP